MYTKQLKAIKIKQNYEGIWYIQTRNKNSKYNHYTIKEGDSLITFYLHKKQVIAEWTKKQTNQSTHMSSLR